jgi:hypothetical protein
MTEGIIFIICAGLFWGIAMGTIFHFDRIIVFVLSEIDAPLFATAWGVAELIERFPEQFTATDYHLKHPTLGDIRTGSVNSVRISGAHGEWEPNFFERRIIWDAVVRHQQRAIRSALRRQIGSGTIEHERVKQ